MRSTVEIKITELQYFTPKNSKVSEFSSITTYVKYLKALAGFASMPYSM